MKPPEQLSLFTESICSAHLVAHDSSKQAFYCIWIESTLGDVRIVKESGAKGRVLDRRSWSAKSVEDAMKLFQQRIKAKTNPDRKSPRIYRLVKNNKLKNAG